MLYLALVQTHAIRALDVARRLFFALVVVSSVLITVALGAVQTNDQLGLAGVRVTVHAWVPLSALSMLGLVLLTIVIAHYERGHRLAWRAVSLYHELGFASPQREWHSGASPFSLPFAVLLAPHQRWGRWLSYRLASFIGATLVTLMTVVGQTLAVIRLRRDCGWTLPVCLFVIVPLATISVGILRTLVYRESTTHRGVPWT